MLENPSAGPRLGLYFVVLALLACESAVTYDDPNGDAGPRGLTTASKAAEENSSASPASTLALPPGLGGEAERTAEGGEEERPTGAGGMPPSEDLLAAGGAHTTTPALPPAVAGTDSATATTSDADAMGGSDEPVAAPSLDAGQTPSNEPEPSPDASTPSVAPGPDLTSFTLVVIGSSTSAGEGASSGSRGWVSLLEATLGEQVQGSFTLRNLSVGGYSSSSLLPNSGSNGNIDDALDLDPNLVLVALAGSNDLSGGVSQDTFLSRMYTLQDAATQAGVPIFFVSTAPKDLGQGERRALKAWADQMAIEFDPCAIPDIASEHSPCFINVFSALANESLGIARELGAGDGIHLNDAGHAVVFEVAKRVVTPYVCSRTLCE
jgi:lysophospholipase L1-like esterase